VSLGLIRASKYSRLEYTKCNIPRVGYFRVANVEEQGFGEQKNRKVVSKSDIFVK